MKRLHIHLSVDNLADSIGFYSAMFAAAPSVAKDDYAKWMLDDPCVNFAISRRGAQLGLNHLGIQVESETELNGMQARLQTLQPDLEKEAGVACCYAKSDKYWVTDPQGIAWETFQTLASIPVFGEESTAAATLDNTGCCVPLAAAAPSNTPAENSCCVPTAAPAPSTKKCC